MSARRWRSPNRSATPSKSSGRVKKTSSTIFTGDRKSTRLNSSHSQISYAVFCLKKKKKKQHPDRSKPHKLSSDSKPGVLPERLLRTVTSVKSYHRVYAHSSNSHHLDTAHIVIIS